MGIGLLATLVGAIWCSYYFTVAASEGDVLRASALCAAAAFCIITAGNTLLRRRESGQAVRGGTALLLLSAAMGLLGIDLVTSGVGELEILPLGIGSALLAAALFVLASGFAALKSPQVGHDIATAGSSDTASAHRYPIDVDPGRSTAPAADFDFRLAVLFREPGIPWLNRKAGFVDVDELVAIVRERIDDSPDVEHRVDAAVERLGGVRVTNVVRIDGWLVNPFRRLFGRPSLSSGHCYEIPKRLLPGGQ